MIPLTKPYITSEMVQAVADVLQSGMISEGLVTARFENAVEQYTQTREAIACCNCTVGLEMALRAIGLQAGDEVIVPDFTYPATANAVILAGGTAVFADIEPTSMLLSPELAEEVRTSRTKAVMPVPAFGNPLDYSAWKSWSQATGVMIIEDAAPALGTTYQGKKVGAFSDITVFSFHPRKNLTTGEGGMIVTQNAEWASAMRSYKHFGMSCPTSREKTAFTTVGTNYKMSDILAALGLEQLKVLDAIIHKRRSLAMRYVELLQDIDEIGLPSVTHGGQHSYQTFCIFVKKRDELIQNLRSSGIEAQIGTYMLHREPAYAGHPQIKRAENMAGSSQAGNNALALPLFYSMTEQMQDTVVATLKKFLS